MPLIKATPTRSPISGQEMKSASDAKYNMPIYQMVSPSKAKKQTANVAEDSVSRKQRRALKEGVDEDVHSAVKKAAKEHNFHTPLRPTMPSGASTARTKRTPQTNHHQPSMQQMLATALPPNMENSISLRSGGGPTFLDEGLSSSSPTYQQPLSARQLRLSAKKKRLMKELGMPTSDSSSDDDDRKNKTSKGGPNHATHHDDTSPGAMSPQGGTSMVSSPSMRTLTRRMSSKLSFKRAAAAARLSFRMKQPPSAGDTDSRAAQKEVDAVNRMRAMNLTRAEKQVASDAFFRFSPFRYDTAYRQLINVMTWMKLTLLPTEDQVQQMLSSVNFVPSIGLLSYHQFLLVIDQWKVAMANGGSFLVEPGSPGSEVASSPIGRRFTQKGNALFGAGDPIGVKETDQMAAVLSSLVEPVETMDAGNNAVELDDLCEAARELDLDVEALLPRSAAVTTTEVLALPPPPPPKAVKKDSDDDSLDEKEKASALVAGDSPQIITPPSANPNPMRSHLFDKNMSASTLSACPPKRYIPMADLVTILTENRPALLQQFVALGAYDPDDAVMAGSRGAVLRFQRERSGQKQQAAARKKPVPKQPSSRRGSIAPEMMGGQGIAAKSSARTPIKTEGNGLGDDAGVASSGADEEEHYLGDDWWQALVLPLPLLFQGTQLPRESIRQYLADVGHPAAMEANFNDPETSIDFETFCTVVNGHRLRNRKAKRKSTNNPNNASTLVKFSAEATGGSSNDFVFGEGSSVTNASTTVTHRQSSTMLATSAKPDSQDTSRGNSPDDTNNALTNSSTIAEFESFVSVAPTAKSTRHHSSATDFGGKSGHQPEKSSLHRSGSYRKKLQRGDRTDATSLARYVNSVEAPAKKTQTQPDMQSIVPLRLRPWFTEEFDDVESRVYDVVTEEQLELRDENIRLKAAATPPNLRKRYPLPDQPFVVGSMQENMNTKSAFFPYIRHRTMEIAMKKRKQRIERGQLRDEEDPNAIVVVNEHLGESDSTGVSPKHQQQLERSTPASLIPQPPPAPPAAHPHGGDTPLSSSTATPMANNGARPSSSSSTVSLRPPSATTTAHTPAGTTNTPDPAAERLPNPKQPHDTSINKNTKAAAERPTSSSLSSATASGFQRVANGSHRRVPPSPTLRPNSGRPKSGRKQRSKEEPSKAAAGVDGHVPLEYTLGFIHSGHGILGFAGEGVAPATDRNDDDVLADVPPPEKNSRRRVPAADAVDGDEFHMMLMNSYRTAFDRSVQ